MTHEVKDTVREDLFDALEDALARGFRVEDWKVSVDDLGPLMETARALLMHHRGVPPIMPTRTAA